MVDLNDLDAIIRTISVMVELKMPIFKSILLIIQWIMDIRKKSLSYLWFYYSKQILIYLHDIFSKQKKTSVPASQKPLWMFTARV